MGNKTFSGATTKDITPKDLKAVDFYKQDEEFSDSHMKITYGDLEDQMLRDICLFNVPNDGYMKDIEKILDLMIATLPAMKRIFARPIIRLKDQRHIVPVEAVKKIDNKSLMHAAAHSEMWDNITENGIKPRKLMTLEHIETYSIYENIVFAYAVDTMLAYIKQTFLRLKDVIYGSRDIHINLLDRTHHNLYFLAIGKLYLEYVNTRSEHENWIRCVEKMMFIDKTLRSRLKAPVYQSCRERHYNIKLKKTNIFMSHRDYSDVYRMLKIFEAENQLVDMSVNIAAHETRYRSFCRLLTIFSASHFNYTFQKNSEIDFADFRMEGTMGEWSLEMREVNDLDVNALFLTTRKDREYTTCMIFSEENVFSSDFDSFKKEHPADEYLTCSPNIHGGTKCVYISMYDIDSFRRIQQILLRGMVWADTQRKKCAFCSGDLVEEDGAYRCYFCGSEIRHVQCPTAEKTYYVSDILKSRMNEDSQKSFERKFLHDRLEEAQLHFRNITRINADRKALCPYCGKVHED